MRRARSLIVAPLASIALLLGCGDSTGPAAGPSLEQLAGNWSTTKLEFVSKANTSQRFDVVPLGLHLTFQIQSSGAYKAVFTFFGQQDAITGTVKVNGSRLVLGGFGSDPAEETFDATLSGSTLTLKQDGEFDFNDDGTDDPATIVVVLERQATPDTRPVVMIATTPLSQSGTAGTAVSAPPAVRVTDAYANPVAGVAVTFVVVQGGGTLTGASRTTSSTGAAAVGSWTLGPESGQQMVFATAPQLTDVEFTAVASSQ